MKDDNYKFNALTPIDNTNIAVYEKALDFVFSRDDVCNVALSGSYGSGKSSVIASYKKHSKKHSKKNFIHISLAHFRPADESGGNKNSGVIQHNNKISTEAILEWKILNQLIHQIPVENIPQTNFRIKKKISKASNIISAVFAVVGIVLGLYTFLFAQWTDFVKSFNNENLKNLFFYTTHNEIQLIAGGGLFAIIGILLYRIIKLQRIRPFIKGANVSGIEVEIFKESKESYFDKYLNDVLYLFDNSGADVIVFEDIDRYGSSEIFKRLREINTLLNVNKKNEKRLRFLYLLRDDIFENKDRTKFFDFIIPIVPVIDGSNSLDKFLEVFSDCGINTKENAIINFEFLQGLSLYIDDMRVLQNICNEFLIYRGRFSITDTEQDPNKLFALITYKNLYPYDFSELQLGRGFMFEIIGGNGKERLTSAKKEQFELLVQNKSAELRSIENEMMLSDELAITYWNRMSTTLRSSNYPLSGDARDCVSKIESRRRYNDTNISNLIAEYDNRMQFSEADNELREERIAKLKEEITTTKRQLDTLMGRRLKEVIGRDSIDVLFLDAKFKSKTGENDEGFSELKDSYYFELLKYLVREGWIDETYSDYMTYFYENSLTRTDKIFMRSVTDKNAKEPIYSLNKPRLVVSRLPLEYFEQEETLNYDLFECLLDDFLSEKTFVNKTKRLIQQLSVKNQVDFILLYTTFKSNIVSLVEVLGAEWHNFLASLFNKTDVGASPAKTEKQHYKFIKEYSYTLLSLTSDDKRKIDYLNDESKTFLVNYISNDAEFLSIDKCDIIKTVSGLKLFGVEFVAINSETANHELLELVYKSNLYVINKDNIDMMVRMFYSESLVDELRTANYTIVMSVPDSPLAVYMNDNIDEYIGVVLSECSETITDSQTNIVMLLNNKGITDEKKIRYISYLKTTIDKLHSVDNTDLWYALLSNLVAVKYSSENIVEYFLTKCSDSFDETLVNFINAKEGVVEFTDKCFEEEGERNRFFTAIVKTHSLNDSVYKSFIEQFNISYTSFNIEALPVNKLVILDELGVIKMSGASLTFIRDCYNDYLYNFAISHIDDYIKIVADYNFYVREEIFDLLEMQIEDTKKIALLQVLLQLEDSASISIIDKTYSDDVCIFILQNNYDTNDFNHLIESYSIFGRQTQAVILEKAITSINKVMSVLSSVDKKLLTKLFESENISESNKQNMFTKLSSTANDSEIKEWLPCVGSEEFLSLFEERKRPKFESNQWNKALLEIFKERKTIVDYELDEESAKISIIRQKKEQQSKDTVTV
jgi:hypothetical protein